MPVLQLELLWLFGHDPVRRAAWRALSARPIANGNPALDYIGADGPTPLRRMELRSYSERMAVSSDLHRRSESGAFS